MNTAVDIEVVQSRWEYFRLADRLVSAKDPEPKHSDDNPFARAAERERPLLERIVGMSPKGAIEAIENCAVENFSHHKFFDDPQARSAAVNNALVRAYLMGSAQLLPPEGANSAEVRLVDDSLNESQQRAIRMALSQPVTVVHGPPGTGKTRTIVAMIETIVRQGNTVAVVSRNRSAIDNVEEKLRGGSLRYARLGSIKDRQAFSDRLATLGSNAGAVFKFVPASPEPSITAPRFLAHYPVVLSTMHSLPNCFKDGRTHQYDYIIVDEASQTDPITGLIITGLAKHLVLVGDEHQLAPIINEDAVTQLDRILPEPTSPVAVCNCPRLRTDRSFLDDWIEILPPPAQVLLNEHYRCHPGIIGFCNQHFYGGKLQLRTAIKDGWAPQEERPIRVRWYEGDYGESFVSDKAKEQALKTRTKPRTTRRNMRQIDIFMKEEWPLLRQRLERDPGLSACVISPYRGQLEELRAVLEEAVETLPVEVTLNPLDDSTSEIGEDGAAASEAHGGGAQMNPALALFVNAGRSTVHTVQGREFDLVYILPVDEWDWEHPWTQKKRLVNVAVSRAKQELVVITSSRLMDEELRQLLERGEDDVDLPALAELDSEREDYCLRKLLRYAAAGTTSIRTVQVGDRREQYGLVRSRFRSAFDHGDRFDLENKKPKGSDNTKVGGKCEGEMAQQRPMSTAERSFAWHLARSGLADSHVVWGEVWVSQLFAAAPTPEYEDTEDLTIDFVVLSPAGVPLVGIEIDGVQHRFQAHKLGKNLDNGVQDRKKNNRIQALGGGVLKSLRPDEVDAHFATNPKFTLLRLPTDGSSHGEFDHLRESMGQTRGAGMPCCIEDVVRRQEEIVGDSGDPVKLGVSLTRYLESHPVTRGERRLKAKEVNQILRNRGVLIKDPCTEEWRVTQLVGRRLGVKDRLKWDESKPELLKQMYWYPNYDPTSGSLAELFDTIRKDEI